MCDLDRFSKIQSHIHTTIRTKVTCKKFINVAHARLPSLFHYSKIELRGFTQALTLVTG